MYEEGNKKTNIIENTTRIVIRLPPISRMTCAQHVVCMCTSADGRAHNSCCATDEPISSDNLYYIFQRLILYL